MTGCLGKEFESVGEVEMGHLIAIEGIDGAGKGTQAKLLVEKLRRLNLNVETMSFPQYGQTMAGELIGWYLNGGFGDMNPRVASMLYAVDRFESRWKLRQMLDDNDVVVLDRYVGSNLAHQGAKAGSGLLDEFAEWACRLEYEVFKMPVASMTILIDMPTMVSQRLVEKKPSRSYTSQKADIHEADGAYLSRVRETYRTLAEKLDWKVVSGIDARTELRTVEDIGQEILLLVLRGMHQCYRLDPCIDFERNAVAQEVHKTWSSRSWQESSQVEKDDSLRSADAAIAELMRQLNLKGVSCGES